MIIQIYGTKKCAETRKAERFFKERKLEYQFRDLLEKAPSRGELETIIRLAGIDSLIDPASKAYRDGGWQYRDFDPVATLLEHPELYRTPIIRGERFALCGFDEKRLRQQLGC